jgi:Na+/H+ antiporter NhaD/arsenite permease-like protein
MSSVDTIIIVGVFAGVILLIALDWLDMMLSALLGVCVLIVAGLFTMEDILGVTRSAGGSIALLFGGMVVARTLAPTGIFDYVGTLFLLATRGSGRRFLLGLIILVAPVCAVLPNATTVILLAPIIISVALALEVDFVGPMVLTAIISNSAGLLTLVGDPATFLVGSSIGMTFTQYLTRVSLGGLLSVLVLVPLLPWIMKDVWKVKRTIPEGLRPKPPERPVLCILCLLVLGAMVLLFIFGEEMPKAIVPPAVAIIAAALALLVTFATRVEPVNEVLQDVDWRTIVFLICLFCLVEALKKTGFLQYGSQTLYTMFGADILLISLVLLVLVGLTSAFLANIPVIAAMLLVVKGYLVTASLVPELALDPTFMGWPAKVLPVFIAMMFAGTLGGNATLIGASANVVSVGICASRGKPVSFARFMRYGVPITVCQLAASALYVVAFFYLTGR